MGDRAAQLRAALAALAALVTIEAASDIYETEPVGFTAQRRFWNMAVRARTSLLPEQLLASVKRLETTLGRELTFPMGPRRIDIDVLLYGELQLTSRLLTLPHPALMERAFVLRPLLDLDRSLRHPVSGQPLADRLHELRADAALVWRGSAAQLLEGALHDETETPPDHA